MIKIREVALSQMWKKGIIPHKDVICPTDTLGLHYVIWIWKIFLAAPLK